MLVLTIFFTISVTKGISVGLIIGLGLAEGQKLRKPLHHSNLPIYFTNVKLPLTMCTCLSNTVASRVGAVD